MVRTRRQKPNVLIEEQILEEEGPSACESPELGFQSAVESTTDSNVITKQSAKAGRRGPRVTVALNEDDLVRYLEEKISDAIEIAYNSISEAAGNKFSSETLLAAFNRIAELDEESRLRLRSIFFDKLKYRLSFMVESLVVLEKRLKVFRFIAKFSANLQKKEVPDFIDCLLDICGTWCYCEDAVVRQNICTLVGFILQEAVGDEDVENNPMPISIRRKLYSILLERQLDKVAAVRAEVIKSVADIQDDDIPNDFSEALERSPKDVILMGLRDGSPYCRLTAVFALHVVTPSHVDYLIELATCDSNTKVRGAAIRQLATVPLTFLAEKQRMDLLGGVIFMDDPCVSDAVRLVLIPDWISFIHQRQRRRSVRLERKVLGNVPETIKEEATYRTPLDSADTNYTSCSDLICLEFSIVSITTAAKKGNQ